MSSAVKRIFFLSFEDALWELLNEKNIPKKSVILIPDFYCMDVIQNIKAHGYRTVLYPLDDNFQISKSDITEYIHKYKPSVVIIFHACGIKSELCNDTKFLQRICNTSLLIEDSVHRFVNPERIKIIHRNHFIIDSLRKVSPLPGSFIYGTHLGLTVKPYTSLSEISYSTWSAALFCCFKIVYTTGVLLNLPKLISYAHKNVLLTHDNLIGDNTHGYRGSSIAKFLHWFIHFSKVEHMKIRQIRYYTKALRPFFKKYPDWIKVRFPKKGWKYAHVYPLECTYTGAVKLKHITAYLESQGMPVWFKYPDCPWSRTRSVLFLPIGFHVSYNEIDRLVETLNTVADTI